MVPYNTKNKVYKSKSISYKQERDMVASTWPLTIQQVSDLHTHTTTVAF